MNKFLLVLLVGLAANVSRAEVADAASTLSVCNRNADRAIFAALLRQVGGGAGWQSVGWYKVESAKCLDLNLGEYAGKAYVYAEDDKGETNWGEGATTFCVDKTQAFAIANADTTACTDAKFKKVKSDEIVIAAGPNVWEAKPNFTKVEFCNKNGYSIYASLALQEGTSWRSRGWYEVGANACKGIGLGKYVGKLYYHGQSHGGAVEWGPGPFQFCVNKAEAFDLPNAEQAGSCTGTNRVMRKAAEGMINTPGTLTITFQAVDVKTVLKLCNTTAYTLDSAYATGSATAGEYTSQGWVSLPSKGCKEIDLGTYTGKAYVYAERSGGDFYWGNGPVNVCVNKSKPFTIEDATNAPKCSGDVALKMVPTFELSLTPATHVMTFSP